MTNVHRGLLVRLFGSFKLFEGENELPLPSSSHARGLLAYLFLNKEKTHSRPALADLLSPESSEESARHTLNQTLWHIRRAVPGLICSGPEAVSLASEVPLETDVSEFERYVRPYLAGEGRPQDALHDLKAAVDLYQGDLLEGTYADWVLLERERLRELYLQALSLLVQSLKAARDYNQALSLALRLAKTDPLRESAHRETMRLYHLLGHSQAALKQYDEYRQLLEAELGLEPEPETVELAREISQRAQMKAAPYLPDASARTGESLLEKNAAAQMPLAGRLREKKALLAMVDPVFNRQAAFVLVEGEPGTGKTYLLQEVGRDLAWRGAQVIWAKVGELEAGHSSGILLQALKTGLTPLRVEQVRSLVPPGQAALLEWVMAQLLLDPASVEGHPLNALDDARQMFAHGLALLAGLWSQVNPLVLVLEDMHWASQDAWEMLADLAGRLNGMPPAGVAVVISQRPEEARSQAFIEATVCGLSERILLNRLDLRPLDREATAQLIRSYLGIEQPLAQVETRLYEETGGNPLFILESLRYLYDQSRLVRGPSGDWQVHLEPGPREPGGLPISPTVESMLARRIARLPASVRRLLQTLSVMGDTCDFTGLRAMVTGETASLLADLLQLVRAHFLVETAEGYRFSHDKLREVAYASLPEALRIQLHAQAGSILEALHPEQVDNLAFHFEQGKIPEKAAASYRQAGEAACRAHVYHQAARQFSRAIELAAPAGLTTDQRFDLLARREAVLEILGDRAGQAHDLQEMARLVEEGPLGPDCRLEQTIRQAVWLYRTGEYDASEKVARQMLAFARLHQDLRAEARALSTIGSALHGGGKDAQAIPYLQSAIPLLRQLEDRPAESKTWQTLAVIFADAGQYGPALEAIAASTEIDRQQDNRPALAMDLFMTSHLLFGQGDLDRAEPFCQQALDLSRETGNRLMEAGALSVLVDIAHGRGRIGQAIEAAEQAIQMCRSIGEEKLQLSVLVNVTGLYITRVGDLDAAAGWNDTARVLAGKHNLQREVAICEGSDGSLELLRGNLQSARRRLKKAVAWIQPQNCPEEEISMRRAQVEVELAAGRPAAALEFLEEAEKLFREVQIAAWEIDLLTDRSLVLLALGRAPEALQAAAQAMERLPAGQDIAYQTPYAHYRALAACGEAAGAFQSLARAAAMLETVLSSLPPGLAKTSRECVPVHHEILAAWQQMQPRQVCASLPRRRTAPAGGSTGSREIQVTWTVWTASDEGIPDKVERRRAQLARLLDEAERQGGVPTQGLLAEALGVSLRTIAQDLASLRRSAPQTSLK